MKRPAPGPSPEIGDLSASAKAGPSPRNFGPEISNKTGDLGFLRSHHSSFSMGSKREARPYWSGDPLQTAALCVKGRLTCCSSVGGRMGWSCAIRSWPKASSWTGRYPMDKDPTVQRSAPNRRWQAEKRRTKAVGW